jgi:hypothetical protein
MDNDNGIDFKPEAPINPIHDDTELSLIERHVTLSRWVAWRTEPNTQVGKPPVKVPYCPKGGRAKSNDPTTWGTLDEARIRADSLLAIDGLPKGVGFMLGLIDGTTGVGGIDLDTCLAADGTMATWAEEIVRRLSAYAEVSPSGTGVKVFFQYGATALPLLRAAMERKEDQGSGRKWSWPAGPGGHPPAIELYLDGRYFAVTERLYGDSPTGLRTVSKETLFWLINEAGPAFVANGPTQVGQAIGPVDGSRSAAAFRLGAERRREGDTFEDMCSALRSDPATAEWFVCKGVTNGGRELRRIWDKTGASGAGRRKKLPALLAAVKIMREHEDWRGVLAFNDFAYRAELVKPIPGMIEPTAGLPRAMIDVDVTRATLWLQRNGVCIGTATATEAVHVVARDAPFHPVRDYLRSLTWDGIERLDRWLIDHTGAADTVFNRAVGAKTLISAVARVMRPGCPVKTVLILEGAQDLGKSSVLAIMAVKDEWFTDHMSNLGGKDARQEGQGRWVIEFAELANVHRGETDTIKAFLSTRVDHFRPPYGRITQDFARQWIGVGTVNPGVTGYLKDETGAARFWPVRCAEGWEAGRRIDQERLRGDRDQLWAEAVIRFDNAERWWIDDDIVRAEHAEVTEARGEEDVRENQVREFLERREFVQTNDILLLFGYNMNELNERDLRAHQTQLGTLIIRLGWQKWKGRFGPNGPGSYYFPPNVGAPLEYARRLIREADEWSIKHGRFYEVDS